MRIYLISLKSLRPPGSIAYAHLEVNGSLWFLGYRQEKILQRANKKSYIKWFLK